MALQEACKVSGKQYFITMAVVLAVLSGGMVSGWSGALRADDVDIGVVALFEGKAILMIDGKRRVLREGDSVDGVELLQADSDQIRVRTSRGEEVFGLGVMATPRNPAKKKRLVLYADDRGFFHTRGKINGRSVRFLVDTGANTVAMSSVLARRLGIDYRKIGQLGYASTAGGTKPMYSIQLDSLELGGMKLGNIDAGVLEGADPETPLLGMSALQHLEMNRSGKRMELREP